jgi:NSS family neurotransmitter:Na+ symporter
MANRETFSSRWGIILAGLGMAVGTGNLWRFPRVAAQNGGAAFLIPWIIFLFVWSLPLLIAEFSIGRGTRRGVAGAFSRLIGGRFAWMGGFVAVTTVMILFYYSVVTGWTLKYFLATLTGQLVGVTPGAYWSGFLASWQPVFFHVVAALAGMLIIQRGVVRGIELANRLMIPALFVLLAVAVGRSITLPGSARGLEFLFNPDLSSLANYRIWLEALTQSAWSTGAGWGLILTYGTYLKSNEDVVLNSTAIGLGNNSASLLAGIAILPVAFAVLPTDQALDAMAAGNEGLMFIWVPQLFAEVPAGALILPLFFLALFFAALSSLIAMIELATRILMDGGIARGKAVRLVTGAVIVLGLPSAMSRDIFNNQDWVWGLALMISGLFISQAVRIYGTRAFCREYVNVPGGLHAGRAYRFVITWVVPVEFVLMFGWWMYQAITVYDPEGWWNPARVHSVGTCAVQWGAALALLLVFNRKVASLGSREPVERTA